MSCELHWWWCISKIDATCAVRLVIVTAHRGELAEDPLVFKLEPNIITLPQSMPWMWQRWGNASFLLDGPFICPANHRTISWLWTGANSSDNFGLSITLLHPSVVHQPVCRASAPEAVWICGVLIWHSRTRCRSLPLIKGINFTQRRWQAQENMYAVSIWNG